jgi:cytochrome P450
MLVSMGRKALKDFTFSNGLTIPAGYTVAVASGGIHADPVGQTLAIVVHGH